MTDMATFDAVIRHVYAEPRFLATLEWHRRFGVVSQLMSQVPRWELEEYVETGQHPDPAREISIVLHEEPDWDWWEPRHDHLWRRTLMRNGELMRRRRTA